MTIHFHAARALSTILARHPLTSRYRRGNRCAVNPAALLDSVVFGVVSQTFPDGSSVPDVGMMVPQADPLAADGFQIAPAAMTSDDGDTSLAAVERTVLALMAAYPDATPGWQVREGQDPNYNTPKLARTFTSDEFADGYQVVVSAEHRQRHERPHVRQRLSLGVGLTHITTGASFTGVMRLSRSIRTGDFARRAVYYTWSEPVTDAMLEGAGVLHGDKPMTSVELLQFFGPWEDREAWYHSKEAAGPLAMAYCALAAVADDPLMRWVRENSQDGEGRFSKGDKSLNPEGLGFRGEGEGYSGHGDAMILCNVRSLYDGGRFGTALYRLGPESSLVVRRHVTLTEDQDFRELANRRSIRQGAAARFPAIVAAAFRRAMSTVPPPATSLVANPLARP